MLLIRAPKRPGEHPMRFQAKLSNAGEILPLRTRHRAEMNCQITKDSIHCRDGWTLSYFLDADVDGEPVG
jgi:hypothetical protein